MKLSDPEPVNAIKKIKLRIKIKLPFRRIAAFTFLFLITGTNFLQAQNATSSPYSRFGIGDLNSITFAANLGIGGTEIGLYQPLQINYGNPAANSGLLFTTYDGGIDFKQYEFKTSKTQHRTNTASVSYFDFAFPINRQKWSLGFGLLPYSKVGYLVTSESTNTFGDKERSQYTGSGGLNNFHISTGFKVSKKLSFGLNSEYLFGVLNNDRTVGYSSGYYYSTSIKSNTSVGWFHFNAGAQVKFDSLALAKSDSIIFFEKKISTLQLELKNLLLTSDTSREIYSKKNQLVQEIATNKLLKENVFTRRKKTDWRLVLGIVASPSTDLHARNSILVNSFRYTFFGTPQELIFTRDTILQINGVRSFVRLPLKTGFGFSLQKGSRWLFCSDFIFQQWSKFSFLGAKDSLVDSWKISAGIQLTPNDRVLKPYWKKLQYRLGFHYDSGYLKFNGTNISEAGVSAGLGIPVKRAGTMLNLAFEAGRNGTTENNLILERYFKITLGFTINDLWFIKAKYD